MPAKYILPILLLCSACYTGKIDCPKPKDVKLKKSNIKRSNQSAATRWVKAANGRDNQTNRPGDHYHYYTHVFRRDALPIEDDVTIEEWDCPQPGMRKYMPKQVQQNIAANVARINDELGHQVDSSRTISEVVLFPEKLLTHVVPSMPR
jgi:hypothetical protein